MTQQEIKNEINRLTQSVREDNDALILLAARGIKSGEEFDIRERRHAKCERIRELELMLANA